LGLTKRKLTINKLAISSIPRGLKANLVMGKRLVFAITSGLVLSSCSHGSGCYLPPPSSTLTSWDGLGSDPTANKAKSPKARKSANAQEMGGPTEPGDAAPEETALAGLKPYSEDWWSVRDAIDRAAEVKLAKKLIICRDCMSSKSDESTASITPQ
jgi:hypothetical protein